MRLLWLTPEVPEPTGTGGAIRHFRLLNGLSDAGAQITVIAPAHDSQFGARELLGEAGVDLRLARRPSSQAVEGLAGLVRRPALGWAALRESVLVLQMEVFWTRIAPLVEAALREREFDAVLIEHDIAMGWGRRIPAALPAGVVFQNAGWDYWRKRADQSRGPARWFARREQRATASHVRRNASRYSHGWPVSDADRDRIAELLPELALDVVPNGVDGAALANVQGPGEEGTVFFSGTLSYPPNADAALWLVQDIFPIVHRELPAARLRIVGRGAPARLERAVEQAAGVELTGWVDDMTAELGRAAVVVAPLRWGSGTKLKVIEALAAGRATVATPVALEGLDLRADEHVLRADSEAEIAAAIIRLLLDPSEAAALGSAGRDHVAAKYDWVALSRVMKSSLDRWLST